MKLRQVIISGSGVVLLGVSLYMSGILAKMKEPPKKTIQVPAKKYVKTSEVIYTDVRTEIIAFGRVRTAQTLDMIAEVSGKMQEGSVKLKEGQSFSKGTLLFRIDDEEARLTLQSQKSNFLKDIATILPDLKIDYSDNYDAWEKYFNSIQIDRSLPELPGYKTVKEKTFIATRNIFTNYYTIKSQESRLKKYRFYAPFDGNIYSINFQSGSYVNPGNNIGRLIRSGQLELKVDVEVDDISWIELGTESRIYGEDGSEWVAKVIRIGEFVNQNTQSIDVFLSIQGKNTQPLFDGQFLRAVIPSKTIPGSMIIPRNILFNGDEVFVVEDTLLKLKEVNVHKINEETVVFSGLEEGAQLVSEPIVNAYNGMTVFKLEEKKDEVNVEAKSSSVSSVSN